MRFGVKARPHLFFSKGGQTFIKMLISFLNIIDKKIKIIVYGGNKF